MVCVQSRYLLQSPLFVIQFLFNFRQVDILHLVETLTYPRVMSSKNSQFVPNNNYYVNPTSEDRKLYIIISSSSTTRCYRFLGYCNGSGWKKEVVSRCLEFGTEPFCFFNIAENRQLPMGLYSKSEQDPIVALGLLFLVFFFVVAGNMCMFSRVIQLHSVFFICPVYAGVRRKYLREFTDNDVEPSLNSVFEDPSIDANRKVAML